MAGVRLGGGVPGSGWQGPPTVAEGAELEADLGGGVALYDASRLMPTHDRRSYAFRPPAQIVRVYHHHSGAVGGRRGLGGALVAARYAVRSLGWPGVAYTYWLAREPDVDEEGRLVVYRLHADNVISYHTGGAANRHGVGVCWQGDSTAEGISEAQAIAAERLCRYLSERYELDDAEPHSTHSRSKPHGGSGKAACPGAGVERWLTSRGLIARR